MKLEARMDASFSPNEVDDFMRGLHAQTGRVRMGSAKALLQLSESHPEALYAHFDEFATFLAGDNQILRWNATRILANLASVDDEGKVERILPVILSLMHESQLITAANVIGAAPAIAKAKPHLADRIGLHIRCAGKMRFPTAECTNVILGHTIRALDEMYPLLKRKRPVVEFVRAQLDNPRGAVRKSAELFLQHHAAVRPSGQAVRLPKRRACSVVHKKSARRAALA